MFRYCKNMTFIFSNSAEVLKNYRKNWHESG